VKSSLLTAAGMLAASGLLLTACASDPTLDETWPEVRRQVVDAQSVRLKVEGGAPAASPSAGTSGSEVQYKNAELAGATDDSHLVGMVNADMGDTSVDVEVLRLQDETFIKLAAEGEDVPKDMSAFSELVGDRWMLVPGKEAEDMADMSLSAIMDDLEEDMPAEDAFEGKDLKAEIVDMDGRKYQKYTLPEEHKEFGRIMYVDPESKTLHRLEDMRPEGEADDSVATFSDWNTVQAPARPADDQIFDVAQLQGLTG